MRPTSRPARQATNSWASAWLEEGILPGQDRPDLAAQRGDPERIAAVDGVRDTEKPAEAGAVTRQRFHMTHDESSSSLEFAPGPATKTPLPS